jgi:hypothetical protein
MAAYDRDTPDTYTASTVDEQTKAAAKRAAAQVSYGSNVGSSVTNQASNTQYPTAGLQTTIDPLSAKQPNETNAAYMQRITQAYKDQPQPTLTPAQEAAGAQVKFVRTGASGAGEYKIIYPIGVPFDKATGEPIASGSDSSTSSTSIPLFSPASTTTTADVIAAQNQATIADQKKADRVSAYNTLYNEFDKYGLGSLVSDIKNYLIDNTFDPSEFSIQLKNTAAYQKRFAANADRIKAGLSALRPAEYIALEDQYQSLMRNYGLPESYSTKGDLGIQEGFNKLIANDVSATELEDRIATAQSRVVNADPNVLKMLKSYYPDITNGDILAYTLDPKNAIDMIKRKVTAAEIGGTQYGAGLNSDLMGAEALAKAGVTQGQYAQAAPFISQAAERGTQLADIYGQGTYNQGSAEAEALNLAGGAQAAAKRKKLTGLETAAFSGSSGVGALGRDKSIYGAMQGQAGLY